MVYFLGAIFFCSFYLLNLVLAVVALSYELEIKSVHKEVIPFFLPQGYNCISYLSLKRLSSVSSPECLVLDEVSLASNLVPREKKPWGRGCLARLPSSNIDEGLGERGRAIINTE